MSKLFRNSTRPNVVLVTVSPPTLVPRPSVVRESSKVGEDAFDLRSDSMTEGVGEAEDLRTEVIISRRFAIACPSTPDDDDDGRYNKIAHAL